MYMKSDIDLFYQAITINPFTSAGEEVFQTIAGQGPQSKEALRHAVMNKCADFIHSLKKKQYGSVPDFPKPLQQKMTYVFLLHIYFQFSAKIDAHIKEQHQSQSPITISWADDFYTTVDAYRTAKDPWYFLALFFQIRRAYTFIDANIQGNSPSIKQLRADIWNCIFTNDLFRYNQSLWNHMEDFSILLSAPTGTGKSMTAKIIGFSSFIHFNPTKKQFIAPFHTLFRSINLTEFSDSLIEAELFGFKKGAFTDASADKKGLFSDTSTAHTILLDEVGETPAATQVKLLRVLQDRSFYPVGATSPEQFHGRLIGATNKSENDLHNPQIFRPDFLYRLSSQIIQMPTLRTQLDESPTDLTQFVNYILHTVIGIDRSTETPHLCHTIETTLANHPWNGNVRELEQCIRRLLITGKYIPFQTATTHDKHPAKEITAQELIQNYTKKLYEKYRSYSEVARLMQIDHRTVKKYVHL